MVKQKIQVKIQPKRARQSARRQSSTSETTALGKAIRMLGGLGGGYLGGMYGQPVLGASTGTGLAAQLSRWLGQGDYAVKANSLVKQTAAGTIPSMHNNSQTIVVRHKEFITEVTGSTNFSVLRSFAINPGVKATFPWLSTVAGNYTEYRLRGMVYHYVPTSGNAVSSTNAALGTVMLQTSYRANEPAPSSKVEMLNEYWASEGSPASEFVHPIECDPAENPFNVQYIRTAPVDANDNILMYDLGTTRLAVSGQQANGIVLGDLWVTYEIELRKPRIADPSGLSQPAWLLTGTGTYNTLQIFGTSTTITDRTNFGITIPTGTSMLFGAGSVGTWLVDFTYTGTTSANLTASVSGAGSTITSTNIPVATATTGYNHQLVVSITNPTTATLLTWSLGNILGTTASTVRVMYLNPILA